MVTKSKMNLTANALLAEARIKRDQKLNRRTRFLVWFYPSLANVAPAERFGRLREASARAYRHWSIYAIGTVIVVTTFLLFGAMRWKWNLPHIVGSLLGLLVIGLQVIQFLRIRWLLRQR